MFVSPYREAPNAVVAIVVKSKMSFSIVYNSVSATILRSLSNIKQHLYHTNAFRIVVPFLFISHNVNMHKVFYFPFSSADTNRIEIELSLSLECKVREKGLRCMEKFIVDF